jgi:division protein CdvB (Snf7/Vps24/ESCRT-III family)
LAQEKSSQTQDQNLQFKQMYKQLQNVNNRLDSIERKLNRY